LTRQAGAATTIPEGGGVLRRPALPGIRRESAGIPGSESTSVARAIEDLERSGYRPLAPRPSDG
jgi:hypothetical protein